MNYTPATFDALPFNDRRTRILNAQHLCNELLLGRNGLPEGPRDSAALAIEALMATESTFRYGSPRDFSLQWAPLLMCSPHNPLLVTPEDFLTLLYQEGTHLLCGEQILADAFTKWRVSNSEALHTPAAYFWPHPVSATLDPLFLQGRNSLAKLANQIDEWKYFFLRGDPTKDVGWVLNQISTGALRPTAVFVEIHEGFENASFLLPTKQRSYEELKATMLPRINQSLEVLPEEFDSCLTMLAPLPWRQSRCRLLYLDLLAPPIV